MKERITEFLRNENKTSAQLAEEIGVQPSGISHILSGRNKPSLDFVIKMLEKYPNLSTEWLIFGKGAMYREHTLADLFEKEQVTAASRGMEETVVRGFRIDAPSLSEKSGEVSKVADDHTDYKKIKRIIWFFENKSFEEFFPGNE